MHGAKAFMDFIDKKTVRRPEVSLLYSFFHFFLLLLNSVYTVFPLSQGIDQD